MKGKILIFIIFLRWNYEKAKKKKKHTKKRIFICVCEFVTGAHGFVIQWF